MTTKSCEDMEKAESDKQGFIHLENIPKDTFLTKLGEDDETSEDSSLFPTQTMKSTEIIKFCIKLTKFLIFCTLIGGVVVTLCWFHLRLSHLEHGLYELEIARGYKSDLSTTTTTTGSESSSNSNNKNNDVKKLETNLILNNKSLIRVRRRVDHERYSDHSSRSHQGQGLDSHVEFRHLKSQTDGRRDLSGVENRGNNNSDSVFLTSISKIPLLAIQEFCSKTKDYCPPGPPGTIGLPGVKGEIGERGDMGDRGQRGPMGPTGIHGLRGPKGEPGNPGVEGRDGLPGEPGLDGVPGRNGVDGISGLEGISGRNGRNGTDGFPGPRGERGEKGEIGTAGLPGVQGPIGPSGKDGIPGIPGVNATVITRSDETMDPDTTIRELFLPPSILGAMAKMRPLVVMEGETVRLACTASGSPVPKIKWTREDGSPIKLGSSSSYSAVDEPLLNFTKVNRLHMGRYICYADNAVTPSTSKLHEVHVNFPPLIQVRTPHSAVALGKTGTLECDVEVFPRGATSWQTSEGKFITSNDTKYQTSSTEFDLYKVRMVLTVTRIVKSDLGPYYCIAKNAFGIVKGQVTLIEWTSSQPAPPREFVNPTGPTVIYGKKPPVIEEVDLCPPAPTCPTCQDRIDPIKCVPSGYQLFDKFAWDVTSLEDYDVPEDNNRTLAGSCQLSAVGKPVFHGEFKHNGSWMRETSKDGPESDKYYKTRMEQTNTLYEYTNKTTFSNDVVATTHTGIHPHFQGNFHAIYNGSFFYVAENSDVTEHLKIIRYSLQQRKQVAEIELPYSSQLSAALYSTQGPGAPESTSKVDLATDENGLWAIYALPNIGNTIVVKIETDENSFEMTIVYGWNITIGHKHAGDMFIICGVLYAVDSVRHRDTKIRLGLDLYRRKLLTIDLPFTNPFKLTSWVSYNPRSKELFTLDDGNLLIYPVKHSGLPPL